MALKVGIRRRGHKYNAKAAVGIDGFRYDSKGECAYGDQLVLRQRAGDIRLLLRQVPFHLPDGVRLVLDFVWVGRDGEMHFEDFKGMVLSDFKIKKRICESLYDIKIEIVTRESWMGGE